MGLLAGLAACSDDSKNGTPVIQLGKMGPGTCINAPASLGAEVKNIPTVPCSVVHSHEVFAVVKYLVQVANKPDVTTDVFPGLEALDAFAQRACIAQFEPYVGVSAFDSSLTFSWLTPTLGSWNGTSKDRAVICVLGRFDGNTMVGSMKGTKT
jgi:hypothetical protein